MARCTRNTQTSQQRAWVTPDETTLKRVCPPLLPLAAAPLHSKRDINSKHRYPFMCEQLRPPRQSALIHQQPSERKDAVMQLRCTTRTFSSTLSSRRFSCKSRACRPSRISFHTPEMTQVSKSCTKVLPKLQGEIYTRAVKPKCDHSSMT